MNWPVTPNYVAHLWRVVFWYCEGDSIVGLFAGLYKPVDSPPKRWCCFLSYRSTNDAADYTDIPDNCDLSERVIGNFIAKHKVTPDRLPVQMAGEGGQNSLTALIIR